MRSKVILAIAASAVIIAGGAAALFLTRDDGTTEVLSDVVGGFSGKVVDGVTGYPLNAEVVVKSGSREVTRVVCDAEGRFGVELKNGTYAISASFDGYDSRGKNNQARIVKIEDGTQYVNAKLSLWPPAVLKGRIASGNRGIQGEVEVVYQHDASGAQDYVLERVSSDEDGVFEISKAYAGVVDVAVEAEGFASVLLSDIVLESGEMVDLGDIPLKDGVSIFGVVRDQQSKKGVSGALVKAVDASGKVLSKTYSGAGGTYRLPAVDANHVYIAADAEGYRSFSGAMQLGKTFNREQDIDLKRAWGLNIELINSTNREPIRSFVRIKDLSTNDIVYSQERANGTFSVSDLKGGPYLVSAHSYDKLTKYEVQAVAGDSVRLLLKPFAKLNVQVVTRQGDPVTEGTWRYILKPSEGADLVTSSWTAFEDPSFVIDELQPGSYRVEVRVNKDHSSSSPEILIAMGDTKNITIQLTEGGVLQGHVVSSGRARPVAMARVEWVGTNVTTMTDRDGYFTLDQLPNRPIDIKIIPNGGTEKTFTGISVAEDSTLEQDFEVDAPRPGRGNGDRPRPNWGNGERPNWGNGERPNWGNGERPNWGNGERPNWGNGERPNWGNGERPNWGNGERPNWGNGERPNWGNGERPNWGNGERPNWGDGKPPWGDGAPPWGDGKPPWGDGAPPWGNGERPNWGNGERPN